MVLAPAALLAACSSDPAERESEPVGGQIVFIRHALTDMAIEPEVLDLANCTWQRNLNPAGRQQAKVLGDEIRKLRGSVSTVLSSGFCRAKDTAQIAFGRYEIWPPLTYHASQTPQLHRDNLIAIRSRIMQGVPSGTILVMVSHEAGLRDSLGIALSEGEAAVLQPTAGGTVKLVRTIRPPG